MRLCHLGWGWSGVGLGNNVHVNVNTNGSVICALGWVSSGVLLYGYLLWCILSFYTAFQDCSWNLACAWSSLIWL